MPPYSQCSASPDPVSQSVIHAATVRLESQIMELNEAIRSLASRLNPVLIIREVPPSPTVAEERPAGSDLGLQLTEFCVRLRESIALTCSIRDQLDL